MIQENLLSMNHSRKIYKLSKKVIEIIQKANGYIFGGAVRDILLHDYHASEFYKKINKTFDDELKNIEENYKKEEETQEETQEEKTEDEKTERDIKRDIQKNLKISKWNLYGRTDKYNDNLLFPEHNDRFIYPNDIDCYMATESKQVFFMILKFHRLRYKYIFTEQSLNIYMKNQNYANNKLKIERIQITIDIDPLFMSIMHFNTMNLPTINVDIISQNNINNIYPPFGAVDFECNALLLTPTNDLMLSPHLNIDLIEPKKKLYKIQQVVNDIEKKIAIVIERVPFFRMKKMREKGWTIKGRFGNIYYIIDKYKKREEEDVCPLCFVSFKNEEYYLKRSCCNGSIYHQECFRKFLDSELQMKCPICSDLLYLSEYSRKRTVYLC